jgi:aminoglycoside N3'-acetyltransferase
VSRSGTDARARTVDELVADLARLGVAHGDLLMVHASLRRIGPVEGRAAGVIDAIDTAVAPDGTWVMILGSEDDHDWVNGHPLEERAALLEDAEPFDHLVTPVLAEVGTLAEVFRTTPGTVVGDHPDGRFGARGERAHELVRDPPWDDYYGPGSTLDRLVRGGGRILRLGANPDTVTVLHHAEYLAEVPDKRTVTRARRVRTPTGSEVRVIRALDDEHGIADDPGDEDYFAVILREYLATDAGSRGTVGGATAELLDAADLCRFGAKWMTENLL